MEEITFEIKRHIGVLSTDSIGWTKEVNLVGWNGSPERLDIRLWDSSHKRMSRGMSFSDEEAKALTKLLAEI